MNEETETLRAQFVATLGSGDDEALRKQFESLPPADAAECLEEMSDEERGAVLRKLSSRSLFPTLSYLNSLVVDQILHHFSQADQRAALQDAPDDDLADFLQELPADRRRRYFSLLSAKKKEIAHSLLEYPEDSAGGRMTTAFATVTEDMTLREAIQSLSEQREETEIISRIYVVDSRNRVVGKVRLRDLTFNRRSLRITDIMLPEPVTIRAMADQEQAANLILKHDMVTLPVLNDANQLIGVITHDDAMEVLQEESTEDLERQSGIAGQQGEFDYLETSVLTHLRRRFFWVLFLALLAIVSGYVILSFEHVLDSAILLAIYMPMVVAAGGNTGAQAATTVIRSMSLGELEVKEFLVVLWKELRIGLGLGVLLGLCVALQIVFLFPGGEDLLRDSDLPSGTTLWNIALTVACSLTVQLTASTSLGAALPILAKAGRLDPAVVASPAITTIVDVTGLVIYFSLARAMLGI